MKKKIFMVVTIMAVLLSQISAFADNGDKIITSPLILTGADAIKCIEDTGFKLTSNRERYMPVQVSDGYHVYIQTLLPGGGYADVAAFSVKCLGGITERRF